jgi:hypothetical protein
LPDAWAGRTRFWIRKHDKDGFALSTKQGHGPMSTKTILLAAAVAALPFHAHAFQGTIQVGSGKYAEGHFKAPGTQQWRVYLKKGQLYAVHGNTSGDTKVDVRTSGGTLLGSFFENWDYENDGGASVKAPSTGYYTVVVTTTKYTPEFPMYYTLAADFDCAGDKSTACGIALGQTRSKLKASYVGDHDWFKASLEAGKKYTAGLTQNDPDAPDACVGLSVRDSSGTVLATVPCYGAIPITAKHTGTYYLEAWPNGDWSAPSTYGLSLRAD